MSFAFGLWVFAENLQVDSKWQLLRCAQTSALTATSAFADCC